MPPAFRGGPARPEHRPAAALLLYRDHPDPARAAAALQAQFQSGEVDPAGLFIAWDARGRVRGAALAYDLGGRQGGLFPPVGDEPAAEGVAAAAALAWIAARGAKVVQAVLRTDDTPGRSAVVRAGLAAVTDLVFLVRDPAPVADVSVPAGVAITPFREDDAAFGETLVASYDGSLDVPELNDTRTADEILVGYRESGESGSTEWYAAGADAVLLLSAGPTAWNMTYLGVVPAARRRGVGAALARFAAARAAAAGKRLTLNCDVRNVPALRLYAGHAFREYDRRAVHLYFPPA